MVEILNMVYTVGVIVNRILSTSKHSFFFFPWFYIADYYSGYAWLHLKYYEV